MVEWKKLGDVCGIFDGTHQTPKYVDTGIRFVSVENINSLYESEKYISIEDYNEQYKTKPQKGDVLMTRIGDVGTCAIVDREEPIAYYVSLALLKPNFDFVLSKYIKYILGSYIGKVELRKRTLLTAVPLKINLGDVGKVIIPIPSLSEQKRIVGILDTFTSSIVNLKQQIAERRKQFEYYRDQLLDLEGKEGVEMKTIKDICRKICSGGTPSTSHKEYYNGNIPWLRTQEVDWKEIYDTEIKITEEAIFNSSAKLIPVNCVIVAMYGATAAKSAINKIPLSTNQACCNLEVENEKALYKYVYHWFCKEYLDLKSMGEGSQNNINGQKIKNYPIPVPSIKEQSRIVSILDTFEASISNLEAQLKEREKQYEYYRNKLLTFE